MVQYNPYTTYYWNGQQGYIPQNTSLPATQVPMNTFAWVQGEAAAKAFAVAPASTVVLMDTENPVLYMKSTDQNGRPLEMQVRYLVTKEDYEKLQNGSDLGANKDCVTKEAFEKFVADVNERFVLKKEYRSNGK